MSIDWIWRPVRRWLPVVPTTSRTFAQAAAVTSFIEVYQGARNPVQPVTLTVSIRNGAEQTVFGQANTIEARVLPVRASSDV